MPIAEQRQSQQLSSNAINFKEKPNFKTNPILRQSQ